LWVSVPFSWNDVPFNKVREIMMSDSSSSSSSGIGLCGVVFVVFLVLKLGIGNTVVVGWSWWWITAPLWGGLAIILAILFLGAAGIGIGAFAWWAGSKFTQWWNRQK